MVWLSGNKLERIIMLAIKGPGIMIKKNVFLIFGSVFSSYSIIMLEGYR